MAFKKDAARMNKMKKPTLLISYPYPVTRGYPTFETDYTQMRGSGAHPAVVECNIQHGLQMMSSTGTNFRKQQWPIREGGLGSPRAPRLNQEEKTRQYWISNREYKKWRARNNSGRNPLELVIVGDATCAC